MEKAAFSNRDFLEATSSRMMIQQADKEMHKESMADKILGFKDGFVLLDFSFLGMAVMGNIIVLIGLLKIKLSLAGYRRFLISLVTSDLFICGVHLFSLSNQFIAATFVEGVDASSGFINVHQCLTCITRSLTLFGIFAILFNLCGMSVDNLIGVWMNSNTAKLSILAIWFGALIVGFVDFPITWIVFNLHTFMSAVALGGNQTTLQPLTALHLPKFNSGILSFLRIMKTSPLGANVHSTNDTNILQGDAKTSSFLHRLYSAIDEAESSRVILNVLDDSHKVLSAGQGNGNVKENNRMLKAIESFLSIADPYSEKQYTEKQKQTNDGYCSFNNANKIWAESTAVVCALSCFFFLIWCYATIFKEVANQSLATCRRRSIRKLVLTTLLLLGAFTLCWVPMMSLELYMISAIHAGSVSPISTKTTLHIHWAFNSLFMLHPFIDTVLYFARVPQLRRYVIGSIFKTKHATGHISNSLVLLSAATMGLNPQRRNHRNHHYEAAFVNHHTRLHQSHQITF